MKLRFMGGEGNLSIFPPVVCPIPAKKGNPMMKIAFTAAAAATVLMTAPLLVGNDPAQAQNVKMAQVDVEIGRDRDYRDRRDDYRDRRYYRDRRDRDVTIGVGPGGVRVGPGRRNCRTVITRVDRGD